MAVIAVAVSRSVILSKEIAHLARRRFRTELPPDVSDGIPLDFPQLPALVRGAGDAYRAAVVLAVALLPVSPQKKPPVIGHFRPDDGEQFWIDCLREVWPCRNSLCRCEPGTRLLYSFCTAAPVDLAPGTAQTIKGVPHETTFCRPAAGTRRPAPAGRFPALKRAGPVSASI